MTPDLPPGSPRYLVNRILFDLSRRPDARQVLADKEGFLALYALSESERQALLLPDWLRLLALGALPNLVYRYYMLHGQPPESFPAAVAASRNAP
jgi:hypothetical protein